MADGSGWTTSDCPVDADGRLHHRGSGPARRKQRKEVASTAVLEKLLLSYYNFLSVVLLLELYIYIHDCGLGVPVRSQVTTL